MKLRELFLREADEVYIVIVRDSGAIIRIPGIPASMLQAEDFEEKLQRLIDRDYPQGNITVQGNWAVVDDEGEEIDIRAINPEPDPEGEIPPEDEIADPGETVPEPEVQEPEEEPEVRSSGGVRAYSQMHFWAERYNRNNDNQWPRMNGYGDLVDEEGNVVGSIDDVVEDNPELLGRAPESERTQQIIQGDDDGDGIIDDTGEPVEIQTDMWDIPDASDIQRAREFQAEVDAKFGGGADGDTGDEGVSGEEGAVTGEQRAEIPSIIEELYRSINGLGTNETRMINALKRIESPAHLEAVIEMYRETYNSSLPQDIIGEFRFQGGNTGKVIDEVNAVMRPLGWQLVGSQWFNLKWAKAEEENADGEEGDAGADEASDPNGIVEGQFGIGWNTNTDSWVIMIPVVWEGERFLVLSNKSEGFLGTGLGAKYYGGRRDPETGEVTPTTAVVDDDLIDALDALVEEKPWIQNDVIPAEAGDPITPFTQAQLRAVGRDEGTEGETLSIDDAEAINQGPQN